MENSNFQKKESCSLENITFEFLKNNVNHIFENQVYKFKLSDISNIIGSQTASFKSIFIKISNLPEYNSKCAIGKIRYYCFKNHNIR